MEMMKEEGYALRGIGAFLKQAAVKNPGSYTMFKISSISILEGKPSETSRSH